MVFHEKLNEYIHTLQCTAKALSDASGLSAATLSRYRSGERVPEANSEALERLCDGIARIAGEGQAKGITRDSVREGFLSCSDMLPTDREQLRQNFNTLLSVLSINISRLCQFTNYDSSTIFRFRNGSRQPSEPGKFAAAVAGYVARELDGASERAILAELLGCSTDELADVSIRCEKIRCWLLEGQGKQADSLSGFLTKLDEFDLNEYIQAIHFDELRVPPPMPFHLPISKTYFGLKSMMESELDFLKATVLSRSTSPVIMYSDMPMGEMAKDPEFPKKWMFGMALMLKKGLHLHQIHNLDRSFEDMMLGLESWLPMYMTGQVSPYYLKGIQNDVFLHFIKVSGTVALSGEAISGHHADGKYELTRSKEGVAYYRKRAEQLLASAHPLMDIYRKEDTSALNAFLLADSHRPGRRRNIRSAPPLYTMDAEYLKLFLKRHVPSGDARQAIEAYAAAQRQLAETALNGEGLTDEIAFLDRSEFEQYPVSLPLSGMFHETDILYTYEEYREHLRQTRQYALAHPGYTLTETSAPAFRNLHIAIHEKKWAMISKSKAPAIHFVIHHPKLRSAIESFVPPIREM